MPKNYKKFTAFDRLTKEILAEWDRDFEGDMFIVKKQGILNLSKDQFLLIFY